MTLVHIKKQKNIKFKIALINALEFLKACAFLKTMTENEKERLPLKYWYCVEILDSGEKQIHPLSDFKEFVVARNERLHGPEYYWGYVSQSVISPFLMPPDYPLSEGDYIQVTPK